MSEANLSPRSAAEGKELPDAGSACPNRHPSGLDGARGDGGERRRPTRVLYLAVLACLAIVQISCSSVGSPEATPTSEPQVRDGWQTFRFGSLRGSAPQNWESHRLTFEEYLELAKSDIDISNVPEGTDEDLEKGIDELTDDDLSRAVIAFFESGKDIPVLYLMPCWDVRPWPSDDAKEISEGYSSQPGFVKHVHAGDVTNAGSSFAIMKIDYYDQFDSFSTNIATESCSSMISIVTELNDDVAFEQFRGFVEALRFSRN